MPSPFSRFADRVSGVAESQEPIYLTVTLTGDSELDATLTSAGGAARRWASGLGLTGTPTTRGGAFHAD